MSALGVSVDLKKVEAVMSWERTEVNLRDAHFLRIGEGYYRRFIEDFSRLAMPMTRLTQKEVKFEWSDLCEKAFQTLKRRLTSALILIFPERG